jgi:translocator protein
MPISPVLALVGFIGLCLLVGLVGGTTTAHVLPRWYSVLHAPPGTPPSWVFAPVWGDSVPPRRFVCGGGS